MKKTLLSLAMLAFILSSCNDAKKEQQATEQTLSKDIEVISHDDHDMDEAHDVINNDWMAEMKMDNGAKWDANIETTDGVNDMQKLIAESKTATVEDYLSLATKLNDRKNTLVKQCTMKGPSHDNLHVFLHPLIEKINLLLKTETTDEGSEILRSIKDNLDAYTSYFK